MSKLLGKADACRYLNEKGYPANRTKLDNLAGDGKGPKYTVVGKTKVYTDDQLDEFIQQLQTEKAKRGW